MSLETTHKLKGFYMEVLTLGVKIVHGFCFFKPVSYRVYR